VNRSKNLAASVRERLRQRAAHDGRPFDEVLTYYAIERFLFRLSRTPHRDRFVLKGALMLPLWGTSIARATRDIDLLGRGTPTLDEIAATIRDCMTVAVAPDAVEFDVSSIKTSEIREQERYGGIRATFLARLERARVKMQVDIGLGDVVTPDVVAITYPALLEMPAPELSGYPVETTVAEKLEAIVDLGLANSRMKDFFDLWSLLGNLDLDGATIAKAIGATFARRRTDIPIASPIGLTAEFANDRAKLVQWSAFVRRLRLEDPPSLNAVVNRIAAFAQPVFSAGISATDGSRWSARAGWNGV
jgi:predicted nucleotidyltransferase component of viral defense system